MAFISNLNSGSTDSEDSVIYLPPIITIFSDDETEVEEPLPKKIKRSIPDLENKPQQAVKNSKEDVWNSFLEGVKSTTYGKPTADSSTSGFKSELKLESAKRKTDIESNDDHTEKEVPLGDAAPEMALLKESKEIKALVADGEKVVPDNVMSKPNNYAIDVASHANTETVLIAQNYFSSALGTIWNEGGNQFILNKYAIGDLKMSPIFESDSADSDDSQIDLKLPSEKL